jgi:hypothetical protein
MEYAQKFSQDPNSVLINLGRISYPKLKRKANEVILLKYFREFPKKHPGILAYQMGLEHFEKNGNIKWISIIPRSG